MSSRSSDDVLPVERNHHQERSEIHECVDQNVNEDALNAGFIAGD